MNYKRDNNVLVKFDEDNNCEIFDLATGKKYKKDNCKHIVDVKYYEIIEHNDKPHILCNEKCLVEIRPVTMSEFEFTEEIKEYAFYLEAKNNHLEASMWMLICVIIILVIFGIYHIG